MAAVIKPYTEDLVPAVKAFNARLHQGGVTMHFHESPIPDWLPKVDGASIYHEYFVAMEEDAVRGAYVLKYQPFLLDGSEIVVGQYRLPLSEGQFDKRYASVGVQMYLDALRKAPKMCTVGLGGHDEPLTKLLVSAGWSTWDVPFYFRVLRPASFLRNIVYLRSTPFRRLVLDTMAATGLGSLAIPLFQAWKTRGQERDRSQVEFREVESFNDWTDDVWQAAVGNYSLIAVRDAAVLNLLYPASDHRWLRLQVLDRGRVVGWVVVLNIQMHRHNFFGNMRVGSLIDFLALPGMESKVACAATQYLSSHGADIVVTNVSHGAWCKAMEMAGLYQGPSNYLFAGSKPLMKPLDAVDPDHRRVHMTRGDGGGPQNLLTALQIDDVSTPEAAAAV